MRFVGTDFVGTLVGTTPENGLKMGYFGSFFGKFIPTEKQEKCPRCLIFTHLGHFTKRKEMVAASKIVISVRFARRCFCGVCDFVYSIISTA